MSEVKITIWVKKEEPAAGSWLVIASEDRVHLLEHACGSRAFKQEEFDHVREICLAHGWLLKIKES